jgi:hypothetical protein
MRSAKQKQRTFDAENDSVVCSSTTNARRHDAFELFDQTSWVAQLLHRKCQLLIVGQLFA